jgi:hypothetical protein
MNALVTLHHGKMDDVFGCSVRRDKHSIRCPSGLFPFLRWVNTRTVAFVLFVFLALLSGGRHAQSSGSASAKERNDEIAIAHSTSHVIASAENQFDRDQNFTSAVAKTHPDPCPISSDAPVKTILK